MPDSWLRPTTLRYSLELLELPNLSENPVDIGGQRGRIILDQQDVEPTQ